jgi:transposase-like protein
MVLVDRLAEALAECDLNDVPNYADIARRFNLVRSTLWRRHVGRTRSRAEFLSQSIQILNRAQEEELLRLVTEWTRRRMPPTPQIVRNLAEEIAGFRVGKNWTGEFVHRHKGKLTSVYLRNMDHQRIKAESVASFSEFYRLV